MQLPSSAGPINLATAARQAVHKYGFLTDLPADAAHQLATLGSGAAAGGSLGAHTGAHTGAPTGAATGQDLRSALWSSIDDDHSRDLDQLEVADPSGAGTTRVRVAIADVDGLVPRGSPLDVFASENATTVYTGVATFPMLPELLSTDRTSLSQDSDRDSIIIAFVVASDGTVTQGDVYRGTVRNQAKLAYDSVGAWLSGTGAAPDVVASDAGLAVQLRLQADVAKRLRQRCDAAGPVAHLWAGHDRPCEPDRPQSKSMQMWSWCSAASMAATASRRWPW